MPRIALYSHDTMGLGHVRRNLALARAIVERHADASVLLISGTHLGGAFRMPAGVDCLTLPALGKHQGTGVYSARHLGCPIDHLIGLRSQIIRTAVERFDPDVLIADNVALGALGELEPTLAALRMGRRTRTVLGLRDILDEPEVVAKEWAMAGHHASIDRYYDHVWVYGDPRVYDLTREYDFPDSTCRRVHHVGYLDRRSQGRATDLGVLGDIVQPYTLCIAGGGQDGTELGLAFAEAEYPEGEHAVLLTGPFCPEPARQRAQALAAERPELHLVEFTEDGAWLIEHAARVIGMAGYNSVCEILSYGKPALLVPRETPRKEQVIRTARFAELGMVGMLSHRDLTPAALTRWMRGNPQPLASSPVRFTALDEVSRLVADLFRRSANQVASVPVPVAGAAAGAEVVSVH